MKRTITEGRHTVNKKKLTAALAGLSAVALLASCSSGPSGGDIETDESGALVIDGTEIVDADTWAAAQEEGTVVLYTTSSQDREDALAAIFTEQTGIQVETVRLGGSKLTQRIQAEVTAGKLGADVIKQSDKSLALQNIEAGATDSYCPPGADSIEEGLNLEDCSSLPLQLTAMAFAANTAVVPEDELPTKWEDLLSDSNEGKLAIQSIGTGGSSWAVYLMLRQLYGVEYWEGLAAIDPVITDAAAASQEAVVRGAQYLTPMVPPGNVGIAIEQGAPLKVIFPDDGTPAFAVWTGLAATPPHPNAAKLYLNWLTSPAGQQALADVGDYSPMPGSPAPNVEGVDDPPTIDELVLPEESDEYIDERDAWNQEWNEIFGYTG